MRASLPIFASICGLLLTAHTAAADPTALPARCFSVTDFQSWKATPDARTMFIRVGQRQYYRLDLSSKCPALLWSDSRLLTITEGSNAICSALDWQLKVGDSMGNSQPCIVRTMTPMAAEEADALPPKLKP